MKAVILAAGFGKRLKPLTNSNAKPSLPFFEHTLISNLILKLVHCGINDIYINLHYKPATIRKTLRSLNGKGLNIRFNFEEKILGTGGALSAFMHDLRDDSFFLINGDILTDINFDSVLKFHVSKNAIATMVIHPASIHRGFPFIGVDQSGVVSRFPYGPTQTNQFQWSGTFTGIQILEPELLKRLKPGKVQSLISNIYMPALEDNLPVYGFQHNGLWDDLGTPISYFSNHWAELEKRNCNMNRSKKCMEYIDESAIVNASLEDINQIIVYQNVKILHGAKLNRVIVWPDVVIREGEVLNNGIAYKTGKFLEIL